MYIPINEQFPQDGFLKADDLTTLGERLIRGRLSHLDDGELVVDFRWKAKGGTSGGNATLGKCVRLTGYAAHYAMGAHFLVWIAADHAASWKLTDKQIEALVYHELSHIERVEPEEEDEPVVYKTRGHDVEMFYQELVEYGPWERSLERLVETVQQLKLPLEVGI